MLTTADELGRNAAFVPDTDSPMQVMQDIDHLSDDELGFVAQNITTEDQDGPSRFTAIADNSLRYYRFTDAGIWVEYTTPDSSVDAVWADDLPGRLQMLRENNAYIAVIPVSVMPVWGDGTFDPSAFADKRLQTNSDSDPSDDVKLHP